ncbi:MAG: ATP-binding cassette domain-containing protein, partial [Steroidobacteraceae bacterium]
MSTALLSARGLMKSFGAVTAAEDVTIEVPAGQRVSLIGSNGAGKTTFVNMVTGYLKPDAGSITLDGRDITRLGPRQISRLGVARSFQIPQLALDMT